MNHFPDGMTVAELKQIIAGWSEFDLNGEPCTVWIESGEGLSAPVIRLWRLNSRLDENGKEYSDILFTK